MPAASNSSSEATTGASEKIGGLLSCQDSTPPAASKPDCMRKRDSSRLPHQPLRCGGASSPAWRSGTNRPAIAYCRKKEAPIAVMNGTMVQAKAMKSADIIRQDSDTLLRLISRQSGVPA